MKARCIVSHAVPLGDGRFRAYAQGIVYDIDDTDSGMFFEPVAEQGTQVDEPGQVDAEQATDQ